MKKRNKVQKSEEEKLIEDVSRYGEAISKGENVETLFRMLLRELGVPNDQKTVQLAPLMKKAHEDLMEARRGMGEIMAKHMKKAQTNGVTGEETGEPDWDEEATYDPRS